MSQLYSLHVILVNLKVVTLFCYLGPGRGVFLDAIVSPLRACLHPGRFRPAVHEAREGEIGRIELPLENNCYTQIRSQLCLCALLRGCKACRAPGCVSKCSTQSLVKLHRGAPDSHTVPVGMGTGFLFAVALSSLC